jgi:DNA repair photolyase
MNTGITPSRGRAASSNPKNRFETRSYELIEEERDPERNIVTQYFRDTSKTILAKNDSPDIPFTYDLNPYRGCEHGCIYCYARPSHEYLGFSSGLDFETKIMVKHDAPALLETALKKRSWQPQVISVGGNTDCYQPIERNLNITRRCLDVLLKYRNPFGLITKNSLITRDIDILKELAALDLVVCTVSITTLDKRLHRVMEPRTASPEIRLQTIRELASAGIPVRVNVAPVIPGLTDSEIPAIIKRARENGANRASWIMLRLPHAVKDLFVDWLQREFPDRAEKVINRIKDVREGSMNSTRWGERMRGTGEIADSIKQLFDATCKKYEMNTGSHRLRTDLFTEKNADQLSLEL